LVKALRLAWTYAPPSGKVQGQGGGWRDESISGCGLATDHTPRPGLKQALLAAKGLCWVDGCGKMSENIQVSRTRSYQVLFPNHENTSPLSVSHLHVRLPVPFVKGNSFSRESISHLGEKYKPSVVAVIALDQENRTIRTGSGFFVDRRGVIATSHHVLEGSTRAIICTPGLLPVPAPISRTGEKSSVTRRGKRVGRFFSSFTEKGMPSATKRKRLT